MKYIVLLISLITLQGCYSDSVTESTNSNGPEDQTRLETHVFGKIKPVNEEIYNIRLNESTTVTDQFGLFSFLSIGSNVDGQVICAENQDGLEICQKYYPSLDSRNYIDFPELIDPIVSRTSSETNHKDQIFEYEFTKKTFLSPNVNPSKAFSLTYYDQNALGQMNQMPLPLDFSQEDQLYTLDVKSLFNISLRGSQAEAIDIAQNHGMSLHYLVSPNFSPETALFHWNKFELKWEEIADLETNLLAGRIEINNLGWWCLAEKKISGLIDIALTHKTIPLSYQSIKLKDASGRLMSNATSNDLGISKVVVPDGAQLTIDVLDEDDEIIYNESFSTSESNLELEVNDIRTWSVSILDCKDEPADLGLLALLSNNVDKVLMPTRNGDLVIALPEFDSKDVLEVINLQNRNSYFLFSNLLKSGNQDSIWLCEDLEVGGQISGESFKLGLDSTLTCSVDTENQILSISYLVFGNAEKIVVNNITPDQVTGYAQGILMNSPLENHDIKFDIHQIGSENGFLVVEFEGDIKVSDNVGTKMIKGNLVARIEEIL